MKRLLALMVTAAGLAGSPVHAQPAPSAPLAAPAPTPDPADDLLAFATDAQRMTVPVSIAGRGPFRFIVDTGSERTVVSRQLAGRLGLAGGPGVRVTAMANVAQVGTVIIPSLRVSRLGQTRIEAPALDAGDLGAAGMLGIDALQGHIVAIDFERQEMVLRPSDRHFEAALPGEIVVRARSRYGQLIVTDAHWHGKRIAVVLDTGSAVSVGNGALLALMKKPPKPLGKIELLSVTGAWLQADYAQVDRIEIGGASFRNLPIAFAEAQPFARFQLGKTPALMLGMDLLRLFRRVRIDFANREVRFLMTTDGMPVRLTDHSGLGPAGG
jgi:predicted aspartyl protease